MNLRTLAQQQRAAMLARDQALADRISSAYGGLWQSLAHRLLKLLDQVQADDSRDALLLVKQFQRLDNLLASVNLDMQTFVRAAESFVRAELPMAFRVGEQDALALLRASIDNRLGFTFGRPSAQAFEVLAKRGASSEVIEQMFSKLPPAAVDAVRKRLLAGLALGQGPREVAASIRDGMKMPLNSALLIAQNELMGAYRTAALDTYRANSDVVTGWTWLASPGACPRICAPMDGTHHALGEDMCSHPRCRCTMTPDTVSYKDILAGFAA